jgi:nucleoside deoxyribosyltransferase
MSKDRIKLYLSAGWFSPEQLDREERVKSYLRSIGIEVFSPKEEVVLNPDATDEERQSCFEKDVNAILECDGVFAITNCKDMGTLFECGFAYANKVPIIYFAEGLTGGFNVMLAGSANRVYTHINDIKYDEIYDAIINKVITKYVGDVQ